MTWAIQYEVRQADPSDRRDEPDAYEVRMMNGEKPVRVVGVWASRWTALRIADVLNTYTGGQMR